MFFILFYVKRCFRAQNGYFGRGVKVDSMQVFKLPRPVVCIGGVLQVELLGRVQTQQMDQLYYIWYVCISFISVHRSVVCLVSSKPPFCVDTHVFPLK